MTLNFQGCNIISRTATYRILNYFQYIFGASAARRRRLFPFTVLVSSSISSTGILQLSHMELDGLRSKSRRNVRKISSTEGSVLTAPAVVTSAYLTHHQPKPSSRAALDMACFAQKAVQKMRAKRGKTGGCEAAPAAGIGDQGKEMTAVKTPRKAPSRRQTATSKSIELNLEEAKACNTKDQPKQGRRKPVIADSRDVKVHNGNGQEKPIKRKRASREDDPLPFTDPSPELLARLSDYKPSPLPVPNLGYACLNMKLRSLKPPIFTSRDLIKRTLDAKGLPYLGELCLANCKDLSRVIQWNQEQGIRFFRISSVLLPWMGTFNITDLPNYTEVAAALRFAGDLARAYEQRLTFHPSHFVKLAAPVDDLVQRSINDLEAHSQIFDIMGYEPSHWNKINIHVGGQYGSKQETILRFAENFKRLSAACQARLTVENDDIASSYSLEDLLELHRLIKIPLVFDFHHHRFCPGNLAEKEALLAAIATWPKGIRPVVHWSESQEGRKPHAHSDYVKGPIFLHGLEGEVDVMIEAKCKEQALLCYRDGLPIPELHVEEPPLTSEDVIALKLL